MNPARARLIAIAVVVTAGLLSSCSVRTAKFVAGEQATTQLRNYGQALLAASSFEVSIDVSKSDNDMSSQAIYHSDRRLKRTDVADDSEILDRELTVIIVDGHAYTSAQQPSGRYALSGEDGQTWIDDILNVPRHLAQAEAMSIGTDEFRFRNPIERANDGPAEGTVRIVDGVVRRVSITYTDTRIEERLTYSKVGNAQAVQAPPANRITRSDKKCDLLGYPIDSTASTDCGPL